MNAPAVGGGPASGKEPRGRHLGPAALLALLLGGCTVATPDYCDPATPCPRPAARCDLARRRCLPAATDGAAAAPDDAASDGGG